MFLSSPLPPPSLAWGFYNSLRTKSVASCKESQVREIHLLLLPHLSCTPFPPSPPVPAVQSDADLLAGPACFNTIAACFFSPLPFFFLPFIPTSGASVFFFLLPLHVHTWPLQLFCLIPSGFFCACAVNLNSAILSVPKLIFCVFFASSTLHFSFLSISKLLRN